MSEEDVKLVRRNETGILNSNAYIRVVGVISYMSNLYILFAPLFLVVLFRRIKQLGLAFKQKDSGQVKVHLLFLSLIIIVGLFEILAIERRLGF